MKKFDSVEDLKADWKRIDHALIPHDLLVSMPQPECKGLTMLTDVMANATVCKLGPCIGQIMAQYCHDIEIVLDVARTIKRRMRGRCWSPGQPIVGEQRGIDRHLVVWVRCSNTGIQAAPCIVSYGGVVPAIDDCVSFVLWAETGFLNPPRTLDDKILYVRDPVLYERNKAEAEEVRKRERRIRLLNQELRIEKGLVRSKALMNLELERQRVRNLGWHELIAEHESAGLPADAVSVALYDLRIHLLSLPAPGHTIGHTLERRESKEDSK
jgi:hypothetical protein